MKQWFSAAELAGLPGMPGTVQNVTTKAKRAGFHARKRAGRGGGYEYRLDSLPQQTQTAILLNSTVSRGETPHALPNAAASCASPAVPPQQDEAFYAERWAWFERQAQRKKDQAERRLQAIDAALALMAGGVGRRKAWETVAEQLGEHVATLYRWHDQVVLHPRHHWLALLAPRHGGRQAAADCSPAAWEMFKSDYLRPEQPAARACYERLQRAAGANGWTVPSLRTLERRIEREIPRAVRILAREGAESLKRAYPAQVRDRSVFHALEAVNADGHKFDVFVKWPDGEVGRPLMVAWQDIYSGKMLAYRVDKTENTDAVRLSFGDVVERYGIPEHAYLDNGRGFAAKWMTGGTPTRYRFKVREEEPAGIMTMLMGGDRIHWTTPYHGQAKPIERAFRDLCEYVGKHPAFSGAYTGNKPDAKPENYGSRAIPIAQFLAILDQEIAAHNARQGRRGGVCAGRSFDAVFAASYERSPIRKATAEQRRLWLLAAEGVAVRRDGTVALGTDARNRYWREDLLDHVGQTVVARFDPQSLHDLVHLYLLDGQYLGEAKCVSSAGFNDSQAAREHARARNQFKRATREQLKAERKMSALDVARQLPDVTPADVPDSRIVRPFRPAVELRDKPAAAPVSDELRAAQAKLAQDMKNEAATPVALPRSDRQVFQDWVRLYRRQADGAPLNDDESRHLFSFMQTSAWRTEYALHHDFQMLVDGAPVPLIEVTEKGRARGNGPEGL